MKHWPLVTCIGVILLGLGLVAARAVQRVKQSSEDKAIATYQIRAAAQRYFVENPEKDSIAFDDLIGPNKYIQAVNPVAGEDYREMFPIHIGFRELAVTMGDGRRLIVFDGGVALRQEPDGTFQPERNDPARLADYQAWVAAGRPRDDATP